MTLRAVGALVLAFAATAVPAAGTAAATTTPAAHARHTEHGMHSDSVRYASLKSCVTKNKEEVPCGPWQLHLHSGEKASLTGARVLPRDAHGKVVKNVPAPVAVSGDGQYVAYIRERDDRLVVRELTGKIHVMPADAIPRGTDMAGVTLDLSLTGAALAVEDGDQKFIRLFDVASGKALGTIPARRAFTGFSGDEDEVLTRLSTDENTTMLITYDLQGNELARREPPQVVGQDGTLALHADGRSVAFYSQGTRTLKVYDLESDTVVGSTRVRMPGDYAPQMIDWTGSGEVTVHVLRPGEGKPDTMTVLRIDPATGATKVRDSYKIKNAFTFAACGG
ncbi:hypothetical protein AB0O34_00540 [Sphaerisporangium sp. NPDC088356]|uniref:hypothetical protein n=1 Tax=Sphaerisporangium sp. NPDC088356 TaxID=3154871 RepID=UPI003431620F